MLDGSEPYSSTHIVILLLCLLLSAFFTSAEFALTTLSKIRLKNMVADGVKRAATVEKLLENMNKLTITLKLGNCFSRFGAMSIATTIAVRFIQNDNAALTVVTIVLSIIILIFCDIIPKSLASQKSDSFSLALADVVKVLIWLFTPIVSLITFVSGLFVKLMGGDKNKSLPQITEAEILTMINIGQQEGVLEMNEQQMISNVFSFGDFRATDIMVPRTDISAVEIDAEYEEIIGIFKEEGYSRLPVYRDTPDTIVGILYLKDIAFLSKDEFDINVLMREPYYTYETKRTTELFAAMKEARVSVSIVLDEYGGTAGLITIEDFIEEIVGDISDEYDVAEIDIEVIKEDEYIVEGSTRLDVVNDMLGTRLESEDFDSIGGYVIGMIGRIPEAGEEITKDDVRFRVESLDKNRIEKVRIFT